jgi:hypothetical protein
MFACNLSQQIFEETGGFPRGRVADIYYQTSLTVCGKLGCELATSLPSGEKVTALSLHFVLDVVKKRRGTGSLAACLMYTFSHIGEYGNSRHNRILTQL